MVFIDYLIGLTPVTWGRLWSVDQHFYKRIFCFLNVETRIQFNVSILFVMQSDTNVSVMYKKLGKMIDFNH